MPLPAGLRRSLLGAVAFFPYVASAPAQMLDHGALEALFEEPVTASATGKPQRASEVPVAMDIITAEQIRRSGAHDIPTVLARYTSLDVQQYNDSSFSVSARGLTKQENPRMLVLVDGRQIYLDDYGRTAWDLVPVQLGEIRQIEVVKGPNTALFGFNAVAGVINIVTFNPAYDRVNNATVRLGTHGYREVSGVATAPLGDGGGVRLSAGAIESTSWQTGYLRTETGRDPRQEPQRYQFATNTVVRVTDNVQASFDASYARTLNSVLNLGSSMGYTDSRTYSIRARVAAETSLGLVEGSVYRNGLDRQVRGIHLDQAVTVVQLSDTVKLGARHTLRPSLEFRHNEIDFAQNTRLSYSVAALGAMWNWAVRDDLDLTLAGRYDKVWLDGSGFSTAAARNRDALYDRSLGTFGYTTGLVWRATAADTVRIGASRGIGMPSLYEMGYRAGTVYGNPSLKPTIVDNYEIGYRRRLEMIDGSLGATAFYQTNRDMSSGLFFRTPYAVPGIAGLVTSPRTIPTLTVSGFELSAKGKIGADFDWGVEYRFANVAGDTDPTATQDPKHASPRHLVSSRLGWGQGPFQADLFLRYATTASGWRGSGTSPTYVTVDDYASLGARVAYRFADRYTVALEGSNLLSEKQRQSIGLEARRSFYLSLRADF